MTGDKIQRILEASLGGIIIFAMLGLIISTIAQPEPMRSITFGMITIAVMSAIVIYRKGE